MSGFDDAYQQANPTATASPSLPSPTPVASPTQSSSSGFADAYNQASTITQNQDQVQAPGQDYIGLGKSIGIGAAKGAGSLLDMFTRATISPAPYPGATGIIKPEQNPKTFEQRIGEALPEPSNKPAANIAQGAVTGAPLGGAGIAIAGGAAAGTEALNKIRPDSPIANTVEPALVSMLFAPGTVNSLLKFGRLGGESVGLLSRSPLVQARKDQFITSGTPASVTASDFWYKMQRGIGEALFGGDITRAKAAESAQLEQAVGRQADKLYPGETTRQAVGTDLQSGLKDGVDLTKQLFNRYTTALDTVVPPQTTQIDMYPFVSKLIDEISPARGTASQMDTLGVTKGEDYINGLMTDITSLGQRDNLPLEAVRKVKAAVGDKLEESILNGDAAKRQLKIIYGNLADAEESAYVGTPAYDAYKNLKSSQAEFYSSVENFVEPLLKEGLTPEKIANQLASNVKLGSTQLDHAFKILDSSAPAMKQEFSSMILQNLGKDRQGAFSATRFFTNWQQISPEAKLSMFGQNGAIPKAYDQLALLAQNEARANSAINPSKTAGTLELFSLLGKFGAAVGGLAGYEASSHQGQDDAVKTIGGAGLGGLAVSTLGVAALGKLMTNPGFVRWLATPTALNQLPMHLRALSAVAGESPAIQDHVQAFQNFAKHFVGDKTKGFMGGGYADFPNQTPTGYALGGQVDDLFISHMGPHQTRYSRGGLSSPQRLTGSGGPGARMPLTEGYLGGGSVWGGPNPVSYAQGGMYNPQTNPIVRTAKQADALITSDTPHKKFAQGGISHNTHDPRPFYNPQLPGAYAEGGPVDPTNAGGNVDIAKALQDKIDKLDRLRTENELDPFLSFERIQKQMPVQKKSEGGAINMAENEEPLNQASLLDMFMGGKGFPGGGRGGGGPMTQTNSAFDRIEPFMEKAIDKSMGEPAYTADAEHLGSVQKQAERKLVNKHEALNSEDEPEDEPIGIFPHHDLPGQTSPPSLGMFNAATRDLQLTPQEQTLYKIHLNNLFGKHLDNADGTTSTLLQTSVPVGNKWYNIPTIWDGKQLNEDQAMEKAVDFGLNRFPSYASEKEAESRYQDMHKYMEQDVKKFPSQHYAQGGYIENAAMGYAEGGQVDRFQQAVNYISQNTGIAPDVAKGAVNYMYRNESKLDPNIVNKTSGAYGISQVLGPRQRSLFGTYGTHPTYENELEHIVTELKTSEKSVLNLMLKANNEKQGYDIWGKDFERSGTAALAKAGVNYKPGDIQVAGGTSTPSIMSMFLGQNSDDAEQPEENPNANLGNVLITSTDDPATRAAIQAIIGRSSDARS